MRLTLRIAAIVAGLLLLLPLHYLWKALGRRSPWPRQFLKWVGYVAGLRIRVSGRPLRHKILLVANHMSWLDIMALASATGAAFVSKDEVAHWPVIGWMARLNNTVFVARARRGAVRDQAASLRAALQGPQPVVLFPEGTTSGGLEVLPFRASLFEALFPPLPGVFVQPVAIDYGAAGPDIAWVGDEGAGANAKRLLSRRGTIPATLRFLDPIDPAAAGDRKTLAERSRAAIVDALGASAPSPFRL